MVLAEDATAGQSILNVAAYDLDAGRNGELRYSLDPSGADINVNDHLMVDSLSGDVFLLKAIGRHQVC